MLIPLPRDPFMATIVSAAARSAVMISEKAGFSESTTVKTSSNQNARRDASQTDVTVQ